MRRPKDAIRAVKKRLNGNRNYREVMLALTVSAQLRWKKLKWTSKGRAHSGRWAVVAALYVQT